MALYLYASGSPFEEAMNVYMLLERAINPYNPLGINGVDLEQQFVTNTTWTSGGNQSNVPSRPETYFLMNATDAVPDGDNLNENVAGLGTIPVATS